MGKGDRAFWDLFPFDTRIQTTYGFVPKKTLVERLHNWDALIFPSRGEGFGLPIVEAMATGLPVITTGWSAPTEFIKDKETGLLTNYKLVEADWYGVDSLGRDQKGLVGLGAKPDIDHVAELMRWVYENREEARAIGKRASKDVARNWTWDRSAKAIVNAKNHYLKNYYGK
jgi:glycosyltransferase involved in cell wall biosynthesis